jgi:GLPGLI family protein
MKTKFKILSILAVILFSANTLSMAAFDGFEGMIKYKIEYEGEGLDATTKAQMPGEMIMYYKGDLIRSEQVSPMYSMASISNIEDGSVIILMDFMGQKFAVNQSAEDIEELKADEEEPEKPEIKYIDETKVIAGYTCKKAEVIQDGETMEVYYTDEISVPQTETAQNSIEGLDGMLMEFTIINEGMTMTMSVQEVKKSKVKKHLFTIPSEYEIKTMEEFKTMFGG